MWHSDVTRHLFPEVNLVYMRGTMQFVGTATPHFENLHRPNIQDGGQASEHVKYAYENAERSASTQRQMLGAPTVHTIVRWPRWAPTPKLQDDENETQRANTQHHPPAWKHNYVAPKTQEQRERATTGRARPLLRKLHVFFRIFRIFCISHITKKIGQVANISHISHKLA